MILLLCNLFIKHFIIDFMMQPAWMYKNKGRLFHYGGIAHAALHGLGTGIAVFSSVVVVGFPITLQILTFVVLFDFVAHYIIDLAKVQTTENLKLTIQDYGYWVLLGFDQLLHSLCYVYIVYYIISKF